MIIVVQSLGLGAGWPQEPVQPRMDEEFLAEANHQDR
jgi:nitroreductase